MNTGPSVSRPPITLGLLVAALLLLVLPQTAAARAITWEGDLQITDSYQHNLALAPGGAYTGSGTTTSNISHSYQVPRQTTEVAPGSGPITVPISYNAAPVAASFSGSLSVRGPDCGGFTRTDTLSGAGTATTVAPNTGNFSYDPATDKLALEPVFNTRQIVIPAATRAVQSGFPCPGQNPQPQNLGLGTPRYLDAGAAGDYRLHVRRDGIDLYVEGSQEHSFIGGRADLAGFGFPVGSTGNFLTLTGAPTTSVGLIEQVSYNLHGTLTEDPVTLTVEKTGAGTATVQSQPAGIDCGADCQARFERNSAVVLEADLADDTRIVRWEGATGCAQNASCSVPMDQDKTVRLVTDVGSLSLTARYRYFGSVTGPLAAAAGFDLGRVDGDPQALAEVTQICVESWWTASAKLSVATSTPMFWNSQVGPFNPGDLPGWTLAFRTPPKATGPNKGLWKGDITETVQIYQCGSPRVLRTNRTINVNSPGRMLTFSHYNVVHAYGSGGRLLGSATTESGTFKKKDRTENDTVTIPIPLD